MTACLGGGGQSFMLVADLKQTIREVPDFPKQGITFYDVSTLFRDARAFHSLVERLVARYHGERLDALVGVEARGFVLASAMAYNLDLGLVLARKPGKLPWETEREEYTLEYGTAAIEMHRDAVTEGQRLVIVDDLLATGGTAAAAGRLVRKLGGRVEGYAFGVELAFLNGRDRLETGNIFSVIQYDGSE